MKKVLSYLVLFAYGTIMLMPVLPYVSDKVAHTFWLYQHISTVHYEHGEYHSHYEATEIAQKTNTDKNTSTTFKYTANADEHVVTTTAYHFTLIIITNHLFTHYNLTTVSAYLLSDYPPPKA
jgi:hypothetical protein